MRGSSWMLSVAELEAIQAEYLADDIAIEFERMRVWTADAARKYFESGGLEVPPQPPLPPPPPPLPVISSVSEPVTVPAVATQALESTPAPALTAEPCAPSERCVPQKEAAESTATLSSKSIK